ncbi:MAG: asparaginase, partial [Firmicutes bacterium]|nr:asparaginase [Bacillota bacterium]
AVKRIVDYVQPNFEYEFIRLLQKDSTDLTDADRELIRKTCAQLKDKKIIITHGTDTMHQTASVLKDIKDKVIVITGAARPESVKESDSSFNVGCAVGAINILPNGVYIAMSGRIYKWDECKKIANGQFIEN